MARGRTSRRRRQTNHAGGTKTREARLHHEAVRARRATVQAPATIGVKPAQDLRETSVLVTVPSDSSRHRDIKRRLFSETPLRLSKRGGESSTLRDGLASFGCRARACENQTTRNSTITTTIPPTENRRRLRA